MGAAAPRPTRLRHEHIRGLVALAISAPLGTTMTFTLEIALPGRLDILPQMLLGYVLWSLAYVLLTMIAYWRTTADQLPRMVSTRSIRTWQKVLAGGVDGPGYAVQFAALALAAAALLPRIKAFAPAPDERLLLTIVIVATVITCWVVVTTSYSVHYARVHISSGGGMDFPGGEPPSFQDYLYFSASVATTFGTTDVNITTTRLRKVVSAHAVLMFVFNTVIVGLMVSALIS